MSADRFERPPPRGTLVLLAGVCAGRGRVEPMEPPAAARVAPPRDGDPGIATAVLLESRGSLAAGSVVEAPASALRPLPEAAAWRARLDDAELAAVMETVRRLRSDDLASMPAGPGRDAAVRKMVAELAGPAGLTPAELATAVASRMPEEPEPSAPSPR